MNKDGSQSKSVLHSLYTNALKSEKAVYHGRASVDLWVATWARTVQSEARKSRLFFQTAVRHSWSPLCLSIHVQEHAKAVCNAKGLLCKIQGSGWLLLVVISPWRHQRWPRSSRPVTYRTSSHPLPSPEAPSRLRNKVLQGPALRAVHKWPKKGSESKEKRASNWRNASVPKDNKKEESCCACFPGRPVIRAVTSRLQMSPFCQISLKSPPAFCRLSCPEIIHHF